MPTLKVTQNIKFITRLFSDTSLTKKAYLNAFAAALDYGARLLVGFLVTPLLVAGLGDFLFGAWKVLGSLLGYISAASGRPTQALKWIVANRQASTDYAEKRRYIGSTIAVWLIFLPILVVIGILLAWFSPSWLDAPPEYIWSVRVAAGLLMINLILLSLVGIPQSVLQGENLGYKRMGLSTSLVLLGGWLTWLALYLNSGIIGVATVNIINTLLAGALFLQVVRSQVLWFGIDKPGIGDVRQFLGISGWFLAWRLVMQLMVSSDVVLLGMLESAEMVTSYTLTTYVPVTLISLVAIVVGGVTPGLGGIIGSGDLSKAIRVRSEIMLITWLIATVVGTTTLLLNQSFINLWVGEAYYLGNLPNLLIMLMVIQFVLIRNDAFIIDLTLDLRRKVQLGVLSAVLSLLFAGILLSIFDLGIVGLCLGFIAGRSIISIIYPWHIGRFLGISIFSQLKSALRPTLVTILLFIITLFFGGYNILDSWIGLIVMAILSIVIVLPIALFIGLSGDQRKRILQRVQMIFRPANAK